MRNIRLSVCIPTYNFGQFIGDTLESIVSQATDEVEIVVVDGGSTDKTEEVVRGFQETFARLIFHRREQNIGVDRDLAKAVELAQGDYCWLMSSDDVLTPGAMHRVLNDINLGHDIFLCNRTECDRHLNPVRDKFWLSRKYGDHVFHLSIKYELLEYLNASRSLGALFSYISSIIVCRTKWNEIEYDETFTGSNYAHAFRLFSIARKNGALKYIKEPLVLCRGDNDSFSDKGLVNRVLIDLNGYELLACKLFADDGVRQAFKAVMQREHVWFMLARLRSKDGDIQEWNDLERRLVTYGYSREKVFIVRLLSSLRAVVAIARKLRSILINIRIAVRRIVRKVSCHSS